MVTSSGQLEPPNRHTQLRANNPFSSGRVKRKLAFKSRDKLSMQLVSLASISLILLVHLQWPWRILASPWSADEEIIINTPTDYHKTSVELANPSSAHQPAININVQANEQQTNQQDDPFAVKLEDLYKDTASQPQINVQTDDTNSDPFAVTFEDFYRDTKLVDGGRGHGKADERHQDNAISEARVNNKLDEENENSISPMGKLDERPDFVFPPPKEPGHSRHQQPEHQNDQPAHHEPQSGATRQLAEETKLEFAWKRLLTSQCSRSCGKGFRLYHFFCIDLKFDVRVDESLCMKANILKPDPMSDEPCNELDCPPEWDTNDQLQHLCKSDGYQAHCEPYKLVRCMMLARDGNKVHVDDSKCNSTLREAQDTTERAQNDWPTDGKDTMETMENSITRQNPPQSKENEDTEFVVDYAKFMNDEKNDILSNIEQVDHYQQHGESRKFTKSPPMNEPFFLTGPWSNCSEANCGQLGKRHRNITCHIYLSRSAKLVELPNASCRNSFVPDTQEPCYVDCHSSNAEEANREEEPSIALDSDETVYDLELTRYVWRTESWTKCTADCLGGTRESITECWDKVTDRLADDSLCQDSPRPRPTTEACNEVPCLPEWRVEPFSDCSEPCGNEGLRSRSVFCVQQVPLARGSSSLVVSNDLCIQVNSSVPHNMEPCNRDVECRGPSRCRLVRKKSGELVRKCGRRSRKRHH